ncbi:DUF1858 domain-containing protein [candidate division WOR-3 bacterium]|uniref:DUF1858 domain-containing protein n=1 Tax=candidate division WOR-3 bacterium TaxID=2052148 RepID=A0A9D5QDA0_UNCW3|nr:DUF1858 domain-containing protein [candidate division WOR-3 bacterium]MBD3364841.1 DUF1858 domain-containing protein [candidate division WOR-3 bacterium]
MQITRESNLEEVISAYPDTVDVFIRHGMPCFVCGEPAWGTVGENMDRHKVADPDMLLTDLNRIAERAKKDGQNRNKTSTETSQKLNFKVSRPTDKPKGD